MKIVIPMAGRAFKDESGYSTMLYEINGKLLIEHILGHILQDFLDSEVILILGNETEKSLSHIAKQISPSINVVNSLGLPSGPASSVLLAIDSIDNEDELLVVNGDQIITESLSEIISYFRKNNWDGGLVTFNSYHPRWSFVKFDRDNKVVKTAEKQPISNQASAGVYFYKHGKIFVSSAKKMILSGLNYKNNFYMAETYNQMILNSMSVTFVNIDRNNYFKLSNDREINDYLRFTEENTR